MAAAASEVFGSRVDDGARGSNIDLLIEAAPDRLGTRDESRFQSRLFEEEEQVRRLNDSWALMRFPRHIANRLQRYGADRGLAR